MRPAVVYPVLFLASLALLVLGIIWWRDSGAGWGAPLAWLASVTLESIVHDGIRKHREGAR